MFNPAATYRVQFHKGFTFADFENIIPHLEQLGISTVYASPIFEATPGSIHGYDVINPLRINPEIGTIEQLRSISKNLKEKNIGWLQDIVPNHMAYHANNSWLMDVLEKGKYSVYKNFFDQSLSDNSLFNGPIMVPFLGEDLNAAINKKALQLSWINNAFYLKYVDNTWPVQIASYGQILNSNKIPAALKTLLKEIQQFSKTTNAKLYANVTDDFKIRFSALMADMEIQRYMAKRVATINKNQKQLLSIANQQNYRLCVWQETDSNINYRRFFTINGLICLNIQQREVFDCYHTFIHSLVQEGIFQGLRIDHIDGLFDPGQYLQRLRELVGDEVYIVVEKILEDGEAMPGWPIQGNTGYDFLAQVNNLLTDKNKEKQFASFYRKLAHNDDSVTTLTNEKKRYILYHQMVGELDNLTRLFIKSKLAKTKGIEQAGEESIKTAIGELLISFPVYRFYGNSFPLGKMESNELKTLFLAIKNRDEKLAGAVNLLQNVFLKPAKANSDAALHFYQRCMQFSGPLMAKGVEDTLMFTYNRFAAHNEVGDSSAMFGLGIGEFHKLMKKRQKQWPLSLNATSTHDTKRGEDVRARLNVLPDISAEWFARVKEWQAINKKNKQIGAPDINDEYLIYQTLIGAYPMPGEDEDNFGERLQAYLEKAMREAKVHTNWASPDEGYEAATREFAASLLKRDKPFWKSFEPFHQKVAAAGVLNSLTQVLLKFTCPGLPDVYQGCEHWDLSLVDPDNRRPVDYDLREKLLKNAGKNDPDFLKNLWANKFNGEIKVWLTNCLLQLRRNDPLVFSEGKYTILKVAGTFYRNVIAFARIYKNTTYIIAAPLGAATLTDDITTFDWQDTRILLPGDLPDKYENILLKLTTKAANEIEVNTLFNPLPFAILKMQHPPGGRSTGVLMHITSLPSQFGIGDFGPTARKFADVLHTAYQTYWQLLPLSPVDSKNQYSPYSSWSAMGGNVYLISPELLEIEGLLTKADLAKYIEPEKDKTDYVVAEWLKQLLFDTAWENFKAGDFIAPKTDFTTFCEKEAAWLDDFALFTLLKKVFNNQCWHDWPEIYRARDKRALNKFVKDNNDAIEKTKWLQFVFDSQWEQLKTYCHQRNLQLIGDLPFYISYDSVDVWAHPEYFSLDKKGRMTRVAGVPPDYFNADGQLWGMPVFNWQKLKANNYNWWLQRIRKNTERFDLLRLDHFRAFSSYWTVPADEDTAINGQWVKGPGSDFFNAVKNESGSLPFIAEDLGEIDDNVYALRDEFNLPGMKVLQFAFGSNTGRSPHIPHNYGENFIAYTGTHDNNTTKGWYKQDINDGQRKQVKKYTGKKINAGNINQVLVKQLMTSAAKTVIIPLQDLLDLDETCRMNTPAGEHGNWTWRMTAKQLKNIPVKKLKKLVTKYNRTY